MASAQAPASTRYSSSSTCSSARAIATNIRGKNCGPSISNSKLLPSRHGNTAPAMSARRENQYRTHRHRQTDGRQTGNLAQTFQAGGQVEIFSVDHQRLQSHHLKAPVIEPGRQQFGVVLMLFTMKADSQRQTQFQLCAGGEVVDRTQINLRGDQRFGEGLDLEQILA